MTEDEYDYFAWAKTGHFDLIAGSIASIFLLGNLVLVAQAGGSTLRIVVLSVLLLGALLGFGTGVRRLRQRRAARRN